MIAMFRRALGSASPLRFFDGHRVQAQLEDGDWVSGVLRVVADGAEVVYDEPRAVGGCVESSRLLDRASAMRLKALVRPAALWTDELRAQRDRQIWRATHPTPGDRWRGRLREVFGLDPVAAEPLLRGCIGRRILVRVERRSRAVHASGVLFGFDRDFLALADAVLPGEVTLPLCPGRTLSSEVDVTWNESGLELFNRGGSSVDIFGVRTAEGTRPWEIELRAGSRARIGFSRAPAGTAELIYERPERGDAILARATLHVLGASEGSVKLPALPDPSTLMKDLPIGTTPESREEPPVPVSLDE